MIIDHIEVIVLVRCEEVKDNVNGEEDVERHVKPL
jgi:hypothetical protein